MKNKILFLLIACFFIIISMILVMPGVYSASIQTGCDKTVYINTGYLYRQECNHCELFTERYGDRIYVDDTEHDIDEIGNQHPVGWTIKTYSDGGCVKGIIPEVPTNITWYYPRVWSIGGTGEMKFTLPEDSCGGSRTVKIKKMELSDGDNLDIFRLNEEGLGDIEDLETINNYIKDKVKGGENKLYIEIENKNDNACVHVRFVLEVSGVNGEVGVETSKGAQICSDLASCEFAAVDANKTGNKTSCADLKGVPGCEGGRSCFQPGGGYVKAEVKNTGDTKYCCIKPNVCLERSKIPCSVQGGTLCQVNQQCVGGKMKRSLESGNNPLCCIEGGRCVNKVTCSSLGGRNCSIDAICSGNWLNVTDTTRCCSGTCITNCSSQQGTICQANQQCFGQLKNATDSQRCCVGTCRCVSVWNCTQWSNCTTIWMNRTRNCNDILNCGINCTSSDCITTQSCWGIPSCIDNDNDRYGINCISGNVAMENDCNDNNAAINLAALEVCNGIDDDCDSAIDEGCECTVGQSRTCGTDAGACQKGTQSCVAGTWGDCNDIKPVTEACDTIDNDCDGNIDENCNCTTGATQSCGSDVGACKKGTQTCNDGIWGVCNNEIEPKQETTSEVCKDGLDNDCDGKIDIDDADCRYSLTAPICAIQNGNPCSSKQKCKGSWLTASDTAYCCSGSCETPLQACEEMDGITCIDGEICKGEDVEIEMEEASDTENCCIGGECQKQRKSLWWIWIIVLVAVAGGIVFYLHKKGIIKLSFLDKIKFFFKKGKSKSQLLQSKPPRFPLMSQARMPPGRVPPGRMPLNKTPSTSQVGRKF